MSTTQRPALLDTPLFLFFGMIWGVVGGAVAGMFVGMFLAASEAVTGGMNDPVNYLFSVLIAGGYVGIVLGSPIGPACGVVLAVYVVVRRAALRHDPVDVARGLPAITLTVVGAIAIWAYVWIHGPRGVNLDFDLRVMLPATIATAIIGWYGARRTARSYLRANGYQDDVVSKAFPRRRTKQRLTTLTEQSTQDE